MSERAVHQKGMGTDRLICIGSRVATRASRPSRRINFSGS